MSHRPAPSARQRRSSLLEKLEARAYLNAVAFTAPLTYAVGNHPQAVVVADVNNDGIPDLITANEVTNTITINHGNADGTFGAASVIHVGNQPDAILVADVNGDNKPDLVVADYTDHLVSVLLADTNGDGGFQAAITTSAGLTHGAQPIALADFNNDHHLDLITANGLTGTISVFLGNNDGTFAAPVNTSIPGIEADAFSVAVGDFNQDNKPDLAVTNITSGQVDVLIGTGDGNFATPVVYNVGVEPSSIAVADLTGSGHQDLVVTNRYDGTVTVLLGNGDGTFASQTPVAAGAYPFAATVADINGDGIPDIVVANSGNSNHTDSTVNVLLGNNDGTFQAAQPVTVGNYVTSVAVTDFNGDGKNDLVTANAHDNTLSVLLNIGPSITYANGVVTITGTPNNDTGNISNTAGVISANIDGLQRSFPAGEVTVVHVNLQTGNDVFTIGDGVGPVTARGGGGSDTILANNSAGDTLFGSYGPDLLQANAGGDNDFEGGNGADTLIAGSGNDTLLGDSGIDSLVGSTTGGNTNMKGGPGADTLRAGNGNDSMRGNGSGDRLIGGPGNDFINGNGGSDTIIGSRTTDPGIDTIFGGGAGNDSITGTSPGDIVSFGAA